MDTFQNKVYAITGLAGIGLAVAKQLHAHGARLSLADISPSTLEAAIQTITPTTPTSSTILTTAVDISSS
jgi:NAD(P)-dependent dehydrogenase (short-subunit alcohol dehydrogenase family)